MFMIKFGKVALFCSREEDPNFYGERQPYGGGFYWERTETELMFKDFWVIRAVPETIRLQIYGDTAEGTIAGIYLEAETPDLLRTARLNSLYRDVTLTFSDYTIVEYSPDIEDYDDEEITINEEILIGN